MNKTIQKIIGILLVLTSFIFLVWKFINLDLSFGFSLVLNILAFMVFGIGLMLMGVQPNSAKNKSSIEKRMEEKKIEPEKEPIKEFKKRITISICRRDRARAECESGELSRI